MYDYYLAVQKFIIILLIVLVLIFAAEAHCTPYAHTAPLIIISYHSYDSA